MHGVGPPRTSDPASGTGAVEVATDADASLQWLRSFEARMGRPLRVLHVGNIANNAYLNVKFLRSVGVEAHVVCRDFDHVMATPEWEEVELTHGHGDDFHPVFSPRDLRGYRPALLVRQRFVAGLLIADRCAVGDDTLVAAPGFPRTNRRQRRDCKKAVRVLDCKRRASGGDRAKSLCL